ncbi:MAG: hypothetical protein IJN42_06190 [Clostridia bacterium]|nr:hypothetical protein [Clostridia bacterium]
MKKVLACLLIVTIMLSLAACSFDAAPEGEISGQTNAPTQQPLEQDEQTDVPVTFGTTSDTKYENKSLGIGIALDETWTFTPKDKLAELAGLAADEILADDVAEMLKKANVVYDMQATAADGATNIILAYENVGAIYGAVLSESAYVDQALKGLETSLAGSAMTLISADKATYTIEGKNFVGIKIHSQANGVDIYQALVCIKAGNYMSSTTVTTPLADNTSEILKNFYLVK